MHIEFCREKRFVQAWLDGPIRGLLCGAHRKQESVEDSITLVIPLPFSKISSLYIVIMYEIHQASIP